MLVDSADGVNEADEGIERRKGMGWGLKKEPRRRGKAEEIKRDMTVTRPKTEMRSSPELCAGVTKLASLLVMSVCSMFYVPGANEKKLVKINKSY